MTRDKYNDIVKSIILPLGEEICGKLNGSVVWRNGWEDEVFNEYNKNRDNAHKFMKHKAYGNEDGRIDRHKIAAALLISLLNCSPLIKKTNVSPSSSRPLIGRIHNEVLSFKTSLMVVISFCREDADRNNNKEMLDCLELPFSYPKTVEGGDYTGHVYKSIYYARANNGLDIYILSNMFFLLESYNFFSKGIKI